MVHNKRGFKNKIGYFLKELLMTVLHVLFLLSSAFFFYKLISIVQQLFQCFCFVPVTSDPN